MALTKDDKEFIGEVIDQKLDQKLDLLEQNFENKLTQFRDDFYIKIDPILKEVVASREDRLIGSEQHLRNKGRIEKLEKIHPQGKHLATV
ncbi:MAG TPA: hypothetical protein VFI61_00880 [Patescibacteria group bacterium]|nr:hypothetical protein [Patescibacteria group bacterium]